MTEEKNKGGRPRRAPGERLQRVTLNLRPSIMFGLDLIARDRQTSLSQAAEYALATVLRDYSIGGRSAWDISKDATFIDPDTGKTMDGPLLKLMISIQKPPDASDLSASNLFKEMKRFQTGKSPLMMLAIPERLRTPEEAFIAAVIEHHPLDAEGDLDLQVRQIKDAFRLGLSAQDAAKQMPSAPVPLRQKGKPKAAPAHKKTRTKRG
ncbi:hypothetical protein ACFCQI_14175 [Rhodanobacter sp. FW102-FHT14D06]|uniref:Uncharacterized protein n=2 Tax=unclassified Rhodanobacter TaxID=2621553 RepID=A0AB74V0K6_9GAMM